jgi:spermidine synthase
MESAVYTDPETENHELVFPYMQRFSYAFAVNPAIQKTLLIGGGAFSYPRYYLAKYPD